MTSKTQLSGAKESKFKGKGKKGKKGMKGQDPFKGMPAREGKGKGDGKNKGGKHLSKYSNKQVSPNQLHLALHK